MLAVQSPSRDRAADFEYRAIAADDVARNRAIGAHGAALVPSGGTVLTHCNTGPLACGQFGTALGIVQAAHHAGRPLVVWVDETRPYLQGAGLTAMVLLAGHEALAGSMTVGGNYTKVAEGLSVAARRVEKPADIPGFARQYLFQDMRYARAVEMLLKESAPASASPPS
mgnify:CR=1 FL=1